MKLRPYQGEAKQAIVSEWNVGNKNVLAVLPTGAGKTVLLASIIHDERGASCCIAHRQELVGQISMALAREGIKHRIIAPPAVRSEIIKEHMRELGQSFHDAAAKAGVAGVDTLVRRTRELANWLMSVTLWVQDEAHHVLSSNKWGDAAALFPNARGLGVTATPERADGAGLGAHHDGVFHTMIEGPSMRWLIDNKFLTDYRAFAPPSDMNLDDAAKGKDGDFTKSALKAASQKSKIVGDVVDHYMRIAAGTMAVVFATDVETSATISARFNGAGIPAQVVSAKTPSRERSQILRDFKARKLLVLVNVDLFGEGFDLPSIQTVIFARPTMSYGLYCQQFGRSLRLMEGKQHAIVIDHVGNIARHGLPDRARMWSLDRRDRKPKDHDPDLIPTRTCLEPTCLAVYEAIHKICPFCGTVHIPATRGSIAHVDGDLMELTPDVLEQMRGAIKAVDLPAEKLAEQLAASSKPYMAQHAILKSHHGRKEAQKTLRDAMAHFGGVQKAAGRTMSETHRRFYFRYKIDVLSAQALSKPEANILSVKIINDLMANKC